MCGKAVRYENNGGTRERNGNYVEIANCALADYESKAEELLKKMVTARKKVEKYIRLVSDPKQRKVLIKYYFSRMDWDDIAYELGCSTRWVQKLHGYALINIKKALDSSPLL